MKEFCNILVQNTISIFSKLPRLFYCGYNENMVEVIGAVLKTLLWIMLLIMPCCAVLILCFAILYAVCLLRY